jgi:hypothetical protein
MKTLLIKYNRLLTKIFLQGYDKLKLKYSKVLKILEIFIQTNIRKTYLLRLVLSIIIINFLTTNINCNDIYLMIKCRFHI